MFRAPRAADRDGNLLCFGRFLGVMRSKYACLIMGEHHPFLAEFCNAFWHLFFTFPRDHFDGAHLLVSDALAGA